MRRSERNGTIELLRFMFCLVVVCYHIGNRVEKIAGSANDFFPNGLLGVEFFFLVSGAMMARHARTLASPEPPVARTTSYLKRKLFRLLPYHLVIFALMLVYVLVIKPIPSGEIPSRLLEYLPNFLLLQKSGLYGRELISPEWYLAAMLVCMLPLYYLTARHQAAFTRIWCPLLAMISISYIMQSTGGMSKLEDYLLGGAVSKAYLRAFGELALGEFCYEVSVWLGRLRFRRGGRLALTAVELLCWGVVLVFTVLPYNRSFDANMLVILAIGLTLTLSGATHRLPNGKLVSWLGRMSLPVYMFQALPLRIMYSYPAAWPKKMMILVALCSILLPAIPYEWLCRGLDRAITRKRAALRPDTDAV